MIFARRQQVEERRAELHATDADGFRAEARTAKRPRVRVQMAFLMHEQRRGDGIRRPDFLVCVRGFAGFASIWLALWARISCLDPLIHFHDSAQLKSLIDADAKYCI